VQQKYRGSSKESVGDFPFWGNAQAIIQGRKVLPSLQDMDGAMGLLGSAMLIDPQEANGVPVDLVDYGDIATPPTPAYFVDASHK